MAQIEWKARGCKKWKPTLATVKPGKAPRRLELTLDDVKVMDHAHKAIWRVDGVDYETRATNRPAKVVYVCEVR